MSVDFNLVDDAKEKVRQIKADKEAQYLRMLEASPHYTKAALFAHDVYNRKFDYSSSLITCTFNQYTIKVTKGGTVVSVGRSHLDDENGDKKVDMIFLPNVHFDEAQLRGIASKVMTSRDTGRPNERKDTALADALTNHATEFEKAVTRGANLPIRNL